MCYFTIIVFNGTIEYMPNVITLKLTHAQEAKLYEAWSENAKTPPQYAKWQLKCENYMLYIWKDSLSGKGSKCICFSIYGRRFDAA